MTGKLTQRAERSVTASLVVELSDGQYAALCDFVYNVGSKNFLQSTLLVAVNAAEFGRVPGQLRRWTIAGGKNLPGLKIRREREITLFFDGAPSPKAVLPSEDDLTPIDIRTGIATTK